MPIPSAPSSLFHVTPYFNLRDVLCDGLLASKSKGPIPRVWLCEEARLDYIRDHLLHHRKMNVVCFATLRVGRVDLLRLSPSSRPGIYCTRDDVPAERIELLYTSWSFSDAVDKMFPRAC